jgi:alpha-tubulin suppressor-like RCC1 family protein
MGDDTFGQCGQGEEESKRNKMAPFFEVRYGKPVKVKISEKVKKITTGYRHNLAVTEGGACFGWGYNN